MSEAGIARCACARAHAFFVFSVLFLNLSKVYGRRHWADSDGREIFPDAKGGEALLVKLEKPSSNLTKLGQLQLKVSRVISSINVL